MFTNQEVNQQILSIDEKTLKQNDNLLQISNFPSKYQNLE